MESNYKQLLQQSGERYLTIHEVRSYLEKSLDYAYKAKKMIQDNDITIGYDFDSVIAYLELLTKSFWTNDIY